MQSRKSDVPDHHSHSRLYQAGRNTLSIRPLAVNMTAAHSTILASQWPRDPSLRFCARNRSDWEEGLPALERLFGGSRDSGAAGRATLAVLGIMTMNNLGVWYICHRHHCRTMSSHRRRPPPVRPPHLRCPAGSSEVERGSPLCGVKELLRYV